jgi:diguanylate cyclase (GGDEF)-like protein
VNRLRILVRDLVDAEVVNHPRYRAWERRHVRSAVRAAAPILVVILLIDAAVLVGVAPALSALNLAQAAVCVVMYSVLRRRDGPRRNPSGAALVLGPMALTTTLLPLGLVPQAGTVLIAYLPITIVASALFIPWNTTRNTTLLAVYLVMVVAFVLSPFSKAIDARTAGDLLTITIDSILVSFAGHLVLQRQRRSMFLQRMQLRDLNQLAAQQGRELRKLADDLRIAARVDPLTGVANRRRLDEDLEGVAHRAANVGQGAALMIDIDRFKDYNDIHGHLAGDAILRQVAAALTAQTRPTDRIYRYGGEEFLVLLPGTSVAEAAVVAERQRAAVASLAIRSDRPGAPDDEVVTVSIGVARIAAGDESPVEDDGWLRTADDAMYASKAAGRNRVSIASPVKSPGATPRPEDPALVPAALPSAPPSGSHPTSALWRVERPSVRGG